MFARSLFGATFAIAGSLGSAPVVCAQDLNPAMIVLDASGSMWGQIDGVNKITIAQDVVGDVVASVSGSRQLGLIAYGHNRKGDCTDIETLVALGPADQTTTAIAQKVGAINPKGKTPLSDAVKQAAAQLRSSEEPATVILVTDGLETCGADPCALGRELEEAGVDFTAHVVGFGLSREQGAQVACLAEETGGTYLPAGDADQLRAALSQTISEPVEAVVAPPPPPRPERNFQINVALTPDHPPLEEGEIQRLDLRLVPSAGSERRLGHMPVQTIPAEPGDYSLTAKFQGGEAAMPVTVNPDGMTHAILVLKAGLADLVAIIPQGDFEIPKDKLSWHVVREDTGKKFSVYERDFYQVLSQGRYQIQAVMDRNPKSSPPPISVEIIAGETSQAEFIIPNGLLRVAAESDSGQAVRHDHVRFSLTPVGAAKSVAQKNSVKDPIYALPGDYILSIEDWSGAKRELEVPVTIAPAKTVQLTVTLPTNAAEPMRVSGQ